MREIADLSDSIEALQDLRAGAADQERRPGVEVRSQLQGLRPQAVGVVRGQDAEGDEVRNMIARGGRDLRAGKVGAEPHHMPSVVSRHRARDHGSLRMLLACRRREQCARRIGRHIEFADQPRKKLLDRGRCGVLVNDLESSRVPLGANLDEEGREHLFQKVEGSQGKEGATQEREESIRCHVSHRPHGQSQVFEGRDRPSVAPIRVLGHQKLQLMGGEPSQRAHGAANLGGLDQQGEAGDVRIRIQTLPTLAPGRRYHPVTSLPGPQDLGRHPGPVGHNPDGVTGLSSNLISGHRLGLWHIGTSMYSYLYVQSMYNILIEIKNDDASPMRRCLLPSGSRLMLTGPDPGRRRLTPLTGNAA